MRSWRRLTAGEVGEEVRSALDRGAVPASISEHLLADVDRVARRADHGLHHVEIVVAESALTADQSQRPRARTVRCRVPRHRTTSVRQPSVNTAILLTL